MRDLWAKKGGGQPTFGPEAEMTILGCKKCHRKPRATQTVVSIKTTRTRRIDLAQRSSVLGAKAGEKEKSRQTELPPGENDKRI